ncbi:tetratricopeptide repeat protein [Streptomyces sp. MN03-5084-2B]|nr:tetratricopeptide repeat protein [Streptomyces sp. MN03-5084-2B]
MLAVAVFGVVGARGRAMLERRASEQEALPDLVLSGRLRRVGEWDDPVLLRVHPAAALRTGRSGQAGERVPPYVLRDCWRELRDAVADGGFVLLVGDSAAGKTRVAYEAVRAVLPDYVLVAPTTRESLGTVLPAVLRQRRCVVWLDDLERFLGADGLTAAMTARMLGDGGRDVLLLATMRTAEYDRYSARKQDTLGPGRETWRAGREVLELARLIEVRREWSEAELQLACVYIDDPRIRLALRQCPRFGLAEALAAGPELAHDWRNAWRAGAHPRGAALVAAAVDCRRAGMHDPVPDRLLAELAEAYLARRQGPLLRPEPVAEALAWAVDVSHGTSSLLVPTSQPGCYLAFDYLIDLPGHDVIHPATWDRLIEHATPAQAFDIGTAAIEHVQFLVAVAAFAKAAAGGVADADIMLADATGLIGDRAGAIQMLEEAIARRTAATGPDDPGVLRARNHVAVVVSYTAGAATAAAMLESVAADQSRVLGAKHLDTLASRNLHAYFVGMAGDLSRALTLSTDLLAERRQQQLGSDHPRTLGIRQRICNFLWLAGQTQRALDLAEDLVLDMDKALGADHPNTLAIRYVAARLTGDAGDPARAVELLRGVTHDRARVLGPDHHHVLATRISLAHWMTKNGEREAAASTFEQALADWKRLLGPGNPAMLMAHDTNLAALDMPPQDTPRARKVLPEFLWTCQQLLGQEHPLTVDTERHLSQLAGLIR